MQKEDHQFAASKGDFVLYAMGSFDDVSGLFVSEVERVLAAIEVAVE